MPEAKTTTRKTAPRKNGTNGKPLHELDPTKLVGAAAKLAWIQAKVTTVEKTGKVNFGKTSYTHMQEHGLLAVVKPLLAAAGCALIPDFVDVTRNGNHTFGELRLTLIDVALPPDDPRYAISARFPNEAIDSSDKASNKLQTNAMKYGMQKLFQVPTDSLDDVEGSTEGHHQASTAQARNGKNAVRAAKLATEALQLVEAGVIPTNTVVAYLQSEFGVDRVTELTTAKQLDSFEAFLEGRRS